MSANTLHGQVAVITGGGRGIGKAAAEQLAALGAHVIMTARTKEQVETVASSIRSQGGSAAGFAADVADPEQAKKLTQFALDQVGRVDILINNAGIIWPVNDVVKSEPDEWAYNIQVNLLGPFYLIHSLLPVMLEQGYGRIVNVSSGAAINPILGASAYSTAKAGMDMMTRAISHELAGSGVTINSFHPGMVDTEMQVYLRRVDTSDASFDLNRFHDAHAQGQLRSPEAVAGAITWLAGQWSGHESGKIFRITDEEWMRQVKSDLGV